MLLTILLCLYILGVVVNTWAFIRLSLFKYIASAVVVGLLWPIAFVIVLGIILWTIWKG